MWSPRRSQHLNLEEPNSLKNNWPQRQKQWKNSKRIQICPRRTKKIKELNLTLRATKSWWLATKKWIINGITKSH